MKALLFAHVLATVIVLQLNQKHGATPGAVKALHALYWTSYGVLSWVAGVTLVTAVRDFFRKPSPTLESLRKDRETVVEGMAALNIQLDHDLERLADLREDLAQAHREEELVRRDIASAKRRTKYHAAKRPPSPSNTQAPPLPEEGGSALDQILEDDD